MNILVVEDCDDSYYVLENYLREAHHQLTRASDGETGIAVFMTGHFDLVFMDVHMPGIDGYTATRAMRDWETQTQRARVPIVILSSDSPATQMHKGAKVGCSGYLTKPVSKTNVLNVVRQYAMSASEYWLP